MEVQELGHLVLYVHDIARSAHVYRNVLGWRQIMGDDLSGMPVAAFASRSLRAAVGTLQDNGVPILGASDHTGTHSLCIADPDGNEIELYIDVAGVDWRNDPTLVASLVRPLRL